MKTILLRTVSRSTLKLIGSMYYHLIIIGSFIMVWQAVIFIQELFIMKWT